MIIDEPIGVICDILNIIFLFGILKLIFINLPVELSKLKEDVREIKNFLEKEN